MTELPKTFDPAEIEARWYAHWESERPVPPRRGPSAEPFTIVIPPPNVTGSLHIGHALDNTLQDMLIRHARLQGKDALWVVGTDHAGIATQMVVERQLDERQQKRTDFTREEFIAKVWEWKAESGGADHPPAAPARLPRCDWANERFTMDAGFSQAVLKVFVELYNAGPDLSRQAAGELGPGPRHRDLATSRSRRARSRASFWHFRYPLDGRQRARSRSPRRGPRRCSPTWRSR